MKKVLSVQDLSCLGKCSLTVALPVLSAMGHSCAVLPTAVLSTHTAFPNPHILSLTQHMTPICDHWEQIGAEFDAISIGYLSQPEQVSQVEALLDRFPALTIVDPVMGDHGKLYSGITDDHVAAVKKLCQRADILVPNITEACLLTDTPYQETFQMAFYEKLIEKLKETGAKEVVLTGVCTRENAIGYMTGGGYLYQAKKFPVQAHGTGDLFAAVLTGGCVAGLNVNTAAEKAAKFVERVLFSAPKETPFGIEFEKNLSWLM